MARSRRSSRGSSRREIEEAAFRLAAGGREGERVIVGVNRYVEDDAEPSSSTGSTWRSSEASASAPRPVRAERNAGDAADAALAEVRRVAETDENLLPAIREALRARCTVGEVCDVLRELWGTYDR